MELSKDEEVEPEDELISCEIHDILGEWQEVPDFVEKDTQGNCLQSK